jgi:hypothetical protein
LDRAIFTERGSLECHDFEGGSRIERIEENGFSQVGHSAFTGTE